MDNKYTGIPPQKLLDKDKTLEWVKANFEGLTYLSNSTINGRSTKWEKQTNYNLINSKFDIEDFKAVIDPFGIREDIEEFPVTLQNHNIVRAKIELLKGEEVKLPFNWNVIGTYGEIIREKDERIKSALLTKLQEGIAARLGGNPEDIDLAEIAAQYRTKYVDIREKNASHIIRQAFEKESLQDKFNDGWEHALVVAEEIYYIGKHKGRPVVRVVNPLNVDFDKDPDLKYIQKGNWFKEERLMSVGNILDEYLGELTDAQISKLDKDSLNSGITDRFRYHMRNNGDYQPGEQIPDFGRNLEPFIDSSTSTHSINPATGNGILVTTMVWRSLRRMDYLNYFDEQGYPQSTYVEQDFKLSKEQKQQGWYIESEWISDIWKATQIGGSDSDIIVDYGPLEVQTGDLPYVGYVYNNTNSKATSLVDLVKAHQYTYMQIMYKIMNEVAKYSGSKLLFDIAQMPTTGVHGMSPEKWLSYMHDVGIVFVNSFEEGTEGASAGQTSKFNQFTMLAGENLQFISQLVSLLDKIDEMVGALIGVSKQREGAIGKSETVGGVERSVIQSSAITASLFMKHNQVKKAVLQQILEIGKLCILEDDETTQLMVDDAYRELIKIDAEQLNDSEYEVLVSDSLEIARIKDKLESLVSVALQSDKANLSDVIKIYQSMSISEIGSTIKEGEEAKFQRDAQAQQAQSEQAQAQLASNETLAREQMDRDDRNKELERQNKIQVATINAMRSKDGATDMNQDGIPDPVQVGQLALKQSELNFKQSMENLKFQNEQTKQQASMEDSRIKNELAMRKLQLEEAKLQGQFTKEQVALNMQANENAQQDAHKKLDLKENEKDRKLKEKEIKAKEKLEKFKLKNKPKPKPAKKK